MPMIPSFLAAATYTAIKVGGYFCFAKVMNKRLKHSFPPLRFGLIKVVCGFVGGFLFLTALSNLQIGTHLSEIEMLLALFPIRYLIWCFVLGYCYKLFQRKSVLLFAGLLGTLVSYLLDLIMWALFGILPGMQMGFC